MEGSGACISCGASDVELSEEKSCTNCAGDSKEGGDMSSSENGSEANSSEESTEDGASSSEE